MERGVWEAVRNLGRRNCVFHKTLWKFYLAWEILELFSKSVSTAVPSPPLSQQDAGGGGAQQGVHLWEGRAKDHREPNPPRDTEGVFLFANLCMTVRTWVLPPHPRRAVISWICGRNTELPTSYRKLLGKLRSCCSVALMHLSEKSAFFPDLDSYANSVQTLSAQRGRN